MKYEKKKMTEKKILVIDDEELVRKSVEIALRKSGYDVTLALSVAVAVEIISKNRFDLIISDIRMPGKNGVEGIREMRKIFDEHGIGDIPVIFITGYASMGDELNAEGLGEVVLKPFDLEQLLVRIREYL